MSDSENTMRHWHFFDTRTGLFNSTRFSAQNENLVKANTPEGYGAIEGEYDYLSQRVDLETGQVVDWQPAPPSAHHEWHKETRRWVPGEGMRKDTLARTRLFEIDMAQHRRVRELLAQSDLQLKQLEDEAKKCRAQLLPKTI